MNCRHLSRWLILLSVMIPLGMLVGSATAEPPVKNPFDLGADDPFGDNPIESPVRDEHYLQMRAKQTKNTIEVIQIKSRQLARMLREDKALPPKHDAKLTASQLKLLVAKNWDLEHGLKQLEIELLKMQIQRLEKEAQVMVSRKDATIAERYKAILDEGPKETSRSHRDANEATDRLKSR